MPSRRLVYRRAAPVALLALGATCALPSCRQEPSSPTTVDAATSTTRTVTSPPAPGTTPGSGTTAGTRSGGDATSTTASSSTLALDSTPACSTKAVDDALMASSLVLAEPVQLSCVGAWAVTQARPNGDPAAAAEVVVLQANGPRWSVVDTATACAGTAIEPLLRSQACPR